MGDAQIYDAMLRDGLIDALSDQHSGWHMGDLVDKYQVSREDQDRWAERSQRRFSDAQAAGKFEQEFVAGAVVQSRPLFYRIGDSVTTHAPSGEGRRNTLLSIFEIKCRST